MVGEGFTEAEISGWLGLSKREVLVKIERLRSECAEQDKWAEFRQFLARDSDSTGSDGSEEE